MKDALPPKNARKKPFKKPTPERLANIALYYLSRFAASEASLRRVLENRIRRVAMRDPDFAADTQKQNELRQAINTIVDGHKKTGALNDEAYAAMKVSSLRRAGRSTRRITQHLQQKGLAPPLIAEAVAPQEDEELQAAQRFAKRKKLGPFRQEPADKEQARKDFAILARAGFSYDTARLVLDSSVDLSETDW